MAVKKDYKALSSHRFAGDVEEGWDISFSYERKLERILRAVKRVEEALKEEGRRGAARAEVVEETGGEEGLCEENVRTPDADDVEEDDEAAAVTTSTPELEDGLDGFVLARWPLP